MTTQTDRTLASASRPAGLRAAVLTVAFGSGFAVLTLEIAGSRVLAPTYGLSAIPWTAIISVVLAGLAAGNALGGRLADRGRVPLTLLVVGAALTPLLALAGEGVPALAFRNFGFAGGAVATAMAFFGLPSMLLGTVTPYMVRRYARSLEEVGSRAGEVSAAATGGAIVGSVATGFVFLPTLPLEVVLVLPGAFLLVLGALSAELEGLRRRWSAALLAGAPPFLFLGLMVGGSEDPSVVYEGQSLHASIRVVDTDWEGGLPVRELWQNGSRSSVEIRTSGEPAHQYQIVAGWLLDSRIQEVESLLVLGGAANTFPVAVKRWRPELQVDVVEIDPEVVEVARRFFSYGELPQDALGLYVEDARHFLRRGGEPYDVIFTDVYDNLYSLPWTMVTREAFSEMDDRLASGGFAMMTLTTPLGGPGGEFLRRVVATAQAVFPHVEVLPTRREEDVRSIREVLLVMARSAEHLPRPELDLDPFLVDPVGPILRDRHAPVEYLQARIFLHDPAWR